MTAGREAAKGPVTYTRLRADLLGLGVHPGGVLMVHARLSAVGWVPGGADNTVVHALLDVLGGDGTLLVLCGWEHQCYDLERWRGKRRAAYLAEPPGFDPLVSAADPGLSAFGRRWVESRFGGR